MRKIIHCDCDCFYAAVEMRDNPSYQNIPLAIGGAPSRRGVISTCNYKAREFGVHSAMASAYALLLCPDLTIISGRMTAYRQVSKQIMTIFQRYTDAIEPLSLDEAYLDVTDVAEKFGSATAIAQRIRQEVVQEVGITISAGVAPNKFIAKIASDWRKPDGLFVVKPESLKAFAKDLPVKKIPGIGPVSGEKLAFQGIQTCGDLWGFDELQLISLFGKLGKSLAHRRFGLDDRPVETHYTRKSVSVETTYAEDIDLALLVQQPLDDLLNELQVRWQNLQGNYRIKGLVVKLKFADFTKLTREKTAQQLQPEVFRQLLRAAFLNGSIKQQKQGIRLAGLGLRLEQADQQRQLSFKF